MTVESSVGEFLLGTRGARLDLTSGVYRDVTGR
jgi:hypothetical protein